MKITYHRCGDYLYPNLYIDPMPPLGKYGLLRMSYLREHHPNWYQSMLLTGKLNDHLAAVDRDADQRMETLMAQLENTHPAPDKEKNSLAWAAHMNMLTHMAEEVVLSELVYCRLSASNYIRIFSEGTFLTASHIGKSVCLS